MKIGEIIPADREIVLNEGKKITKILVANKGDRPVQVGSHFHFFEVNKRVFGLNDLTRARAAEDTKKASMEKAALKGFL